MCYRSKIVLTPSEKEAVLNRIPRLSYNDARRLRDPIYQTLVKELYEAGCRNAAKYFICLAKKEQEEHAKQNIQYTMKNNRPLLMALYENIKLAEQASVLDCMGGMPACLEILQEVLKLLSSHSAVYGWLVHDAYEIVIRIADKHDKNILCSKIRSQLYYSYAIYKGRHTSSYNLRKVLEYFEKSLQLCRGQNWTLEGVAETESSQHQSQHDFVARELTRSLLVYAETFTDKDPDAGAELAHQAVTVIKEVQTHNNVLMCEAYLVKIRFLCEAHKYKEAMANAAVVEEPIMKAKGTEHGRLTGELNLLKGRCYQALKEPAKAIIKFKQSVLIGKKFGLDTLCGNAFVDMGRLYMHFTEGIPKAQYCFEEACNIFDGTDDKHRKVGATYLLAKLQASDHFSGLMKLMKRSDQFCTLHKLRRWKSLNQPFWATDGTMADEPLGANPLLDTVSKISISISHVTASQSVVGDETSYGYSLSEYDITVSDDSIFESEDDIIRRLTVVRKPDDLHCLLEEPF